MIKKILAFIFLATSTIHAQHTINGTMNSAPETDWIILYKIEGAKQIFVKNTTIKKDTISNNDIIKITGKFNFVLPETAEKGSYRVTYSLEGNGFIDFMYTKENISFTFDKENPYNTVSFLDSKENTEYKNYQLAIFNAQEKLDSIQIAVLKNPNLNITKKDIKNYKKAYEAINSIQNQYLAATKNSYIYPFVVASTKNNSSEILASSEEYMQNIKNTFFDNIDFSNKTLLNSSFLAEKVSNYIFYLNGSEDIDTQQNLYKESVKTVFSKITNTLLRKDMLEFLIVQFERLKNIELVDELFEKHYTSLPATLKDSKFKDEILANLRAEVGRFAPDFSWKENGKTIKLSTLESAENYVLVFWSTGCSHCLKEIPLLHTFMQGNTKAKVISFAMEKDELDFNNLKHTLFGWHTVLGLNKWENKTARTYNINSTPTYFILDANKKIIAKPDTLEELESLIENL